MLIYIDSVQLIIAITVKIVFRVCYRARFGEELAAHVHAVRVHEALGMRIDVQYTRTCKASVCGCGESFDCHLAAHSAFDLLMCLALEGYSSYNYTVPCFVLRRVLQCKFNRSQACVASLELRYHARRESSRLPDREEATMQDFFAPLGC